MSKTALKTSEVEREVGVRRLLSLIDEVQERLTAIRRLAEIQIESSNESCNGNGVRHA
jgi:hypothetical protein